MTDGLSRTTAGECNVFSADRLGNSVSYWIALFCLPQSLASGSLDPFLLPGAFLHSYCAPGLLYASRVLFAFGHTYPFPILHILPLGDIRMKQHNWKPYAIWILITEAVGALSGWLTREGNQIFQQTAQQPPLSPPPLVFPIVWGILYALMGFSAARIYLSSPSIARSRGLNLYIAQLVVNFFWSLIFFNAQAFGFAFVWLLLLWALVLAMILTFRTIDPLAAWLQVPYLIWLTFAAYLNLGVWYLNR